MNVIEVEKLQKSFRIPSVHRDTIRQHALAFFWPRQFRDYPVLRDINFTVKRGEAFGIMGRNGSGKSTLLKIVAGIYAPDAGSVKVNGPVTPILGLGLGWNGELTARDNLFLTGTAMGMTRKELHKSLDEIFEFAELQEFVDMQVKFYSSGMSARLAFAIAFQAVQDILLLDEIFAVGDASFQTKCQERYQKLHAAGHTLVLVSHSGKDITRWCERAMLIEQGNVLTSGPSSEVAAKYLELLGGEE